MYTEEQAQKAIRDKMIADMNKQIALWNHQTAVEWVKQYNLPYRVALDYQKQAIKRDKLLISINPWYPMPKIPIVAELSQEERTNKRMLEIQSIDGGKAWLDSIVIHIGEINSEGKGKVSFDWHKCRDEEFQREQAIIDEMAIQRAEPYKPWNLETKQGLEQWERYFALYIAPYEKVLPSWNSFNMFGDTKHSDNELNERKAYYMDLIHRFNTDTQGLFDKEIPRKQLADYDLYDFYEHGIPLSDFYMWDNYSKEPPKHPQALQIMKKELKMYERAEKEHYFGYRDTIETSKGIIERLEQGNE